MAYLVQKEWDGDPLQWRIQQQLKGVGWIMFRIHEWVNRSKSDEWHLKDPEIGGLVPACLSRGRIKQNSGGGGGREGN